MASKALLNARNISLLFVCFGVMGGLWIFSIILFSERFPDPDILRRWELIPAFGFLLLAAQLIFFQIRQTKRNLENSHAALERARMALKARSQCSQVLVRATVEDDLMETICRIIVESEGYRLAWVGFAFDDPEKSVRPVAQWGHENDYLESLKVSWGENEHGGGPTGIAIRTGKPCVAQHIRTDPKWEPWRQRAIACGYAASLSLPLAEDGRIFGALVIFAGEPDAFDNREVELLKGLAGDLSYGIATLRLRKEQERGRQERLLLAAVIEQETDGVMTFDTDGRIKFVNTAFEAVSGHQRDELIGRRVRELDKDGPNRQFFRLMIASQVHGEAGSGRFINQRPDGTAYEIEARVFPVFGADGITAFAAMIRDMTHEMKLQRQLRQAQKMEAIATLSGGIAHDFNNVLAAITTNTEMALDYVPEESIAREHLAIVLKAGFRAKNLVKQIMTLSCQTEKERQPVRLDQVVGECMNLLRASLPATIEMRRRTGGEHGLVQADPGQIHQVIMNLCTNAADAMRESGGRLEISLHTVELNETDPGIVPHLPAGRYVRLSIADTGHGIPAAITERVFDPFFTTKGPGRGTGLGLSVVHGIIKSHGGGISFTSEAGSGTTFHVFLPRTDRARESAQEHADIPLPGGNERVLFLDDEEDLVFAGQRMLAKLGYDVVAGTDSVEALAVFRSQPERFDLVITDQTMPRMTGARLAREIRSLRPDIPIVLCTGLGCGGETGINEADARAAGISEILMKPVERSEFARAIRRVLDQNR